MVTECCSESRMTSRTSRGVLEWSGGKDLYMGSPALDTRSVLGVIGNVPGPPEGFGGPPGGATSPGGLRGPSVGRDQPLGGLVRPPQGAQGAGEGGRGQTLGQMGPKAHAPCASHSSPPLLAAAPDAIWRLAAAPWGGKTLKGAQPPSPLYIVGVFGAAIHMRTSLSWRNPTPLPPRLSQCLAKPCWSATLLHHHHAIVLLLDGVFLNLSLSPCWIKAWETSPGCTCVERGGAVRSALDHR